VGSAQTILFWADNYYTRAAATVGANMGYQYAPLSKLMTATLTTVGASATGKTKAKPAKNSNIVKLTADQSTKSLSAKLTNAYAVAVGDAIEKALTQHQAAEAQTKTTAKPISGYQVLEPAEATAATRATSGGSSLGSSRKVRGLAGLIIGLVVGALLVLLREVANRKLRTASGVAAATRYPVVAEIPAGPTTRPGGPPAVLLAVVEEPRSAAAEAYRMLRMSVMFEELSAGAITSDLFGAAPPGAWETPANPRYTKPDPGSRQVLLVVSSAGEESRPIVAANLGATYAEAGQRAIVVSTDDLDSGYAPAGGRPPSGSITPDVVASYLQPSSLPNVMRLSFRHFIANSGQLVNLAPEVLAATRHLADVIIVESPPFLESHHGEALVHAVDAVIVVVESRVTTIDEGKRTGAILRRLGAPVLGVVLTAVGNAGRTVQRPADPPRPVATPTPEPTVDPRAIPEAAKS
jgi:Mrp family chromosome partitioning ATPase